ncbi:MAG: FAD-dependent monooxygenase [Comamonadaceae bacterium]|nr:FAD-dependent monooxygenase [Burkholderiales bacterium]MEB2348995.1 FAD-dependent monooxygenase [Comamonadaceae bacterium]
MVQPRQILIAGGGIGGLAAALACRRAGWEVRLAERADAFGEIGAGVQLGPNAMRCLAAWGLEAPVRTVACFPERLRVHRAGDGAELATLGLGAALAGRYGAPYATIHRADLHRVLLDAVQALPGVQLHLGQELTQWEQDSMAVTARVRHDDGVEVETQADALLGADGLRSRVRSVLLGDDAVHPAGHLAYRAVAAQRSLPARLRSQDVTVWLGPHLHVVHYPLRGGELLNLVAICHGRPPSDLVHWDHAAHADDVRALLSGACTELRDRVGALAQSGGVWRLWPLLERPPVAAPEEMARGLVALLGDAAHPMRPYLAQGAGMALEDAAELQQALAMDALDVPLRLRRYALNRWQRVARVQRRSRRNGGIFHATGALRVARDASLRLLGGHLLDLPWLYAGGPAVPPDAGASVN